MHTLDGACTRGDGQGIPLGDQSIGYQVWVYLKFRDTLTAQSMAEGLSC